MSEQNCGNCNAFLFNKDMQVKPGIAHQGWCRAKPPMLVQTMVQVSSKLAPGGAQMAPGFQGVFPPTASDCWCRDWQPAWSKNARVPPTIEGKVNDAADQPSAA